MRSFFKKLSRILIWLLPLLLSYLLFFYVLPFYLSDQILTQTSQLLLLISIIGLLNNNNFGFSQFITYQSVREQLSRRDIGQIICLLALIALILIGVLFSMTQIQLSVPTLILLVCVSLSCVPRAIFEASQSFFKSGMIKVIFNSALCLLVVFFWELAVSQKILAFAYLFLLSILIRAIFSGELISKHNESNGIDWKIWFRFFTSFLLISIFIYFDRFIVLVIRPASFDAFVLLFEQIFRIALPLNIAFMFIFPKLSQNRERSAFFRDRSLKRIFFGMIIYLLFAPFIFYVFYFQTALIKSPSLAELYASVFGIASYLLTCHSIGFLVNLNTHFWKFVFVPTLVVGVVLVFFISEIWMLIGIKAMVLVLGYAYWLFRHGVR